MSSEKISLHVIAKSKGVVGGNAGNADCGCGTVCYLSASSPTRGIPGALLFMAVGFGVGWLLGGSGMDTRRVLALGAAQRNIAAALVVSGQSFSDPKVVVMIVVADIVGLLVLMPLSRVLGQRSPVRLAEGP